MKMYIKMIRLSFVLMMSSYCFANPNDPGDCIVSEWGEWGTCSMKCSSGKKIRERTIIKPLTNLFAKQCPPDLSQSAPCGIKNNGCEQFCDESNGACGCKNGLKLNTDGKTCIDHNECEINFGRGPCVQKCINTFGSYKCACNPSYYLTDDKHNCHFNESAYPCDFETHIYDSKDNCVCRNANLEGFKCNQDKNRCKDSFKCTKDSVCIKFIHAKDTCVSRVYLIPVLLPLPYENYIQGDFRYLVESYITKILEGDTPKRTLFAESEKSNIRSNNYINQYFYVESNKAQKAKSFTYLQFFVLDSNDFRPVDRQIVCSKLSGTDVHCLNIKECNILKTDGKSCTFTYSEKSISEEASSSKAWIIVVVCIIILAVLILAIVCYIKRRGHWKKLTLSYNRRNEEVRCQNESPLLQVNEPPPPYTPNDGDNLQHLDNFDTPIFNNEPSQSKTDSPDKHVYESVENLKLMLPEYNEYEEMDSCEKKGLCVDLSVSDQEPRYIAPVSRPAEGECSSSTAIDPSEHYQTRISNKPLINPDEVSI